MPKTAPSPITFAVSDPLPHEHGLTADGEILTTKLRAHLRDQLQAGDLDTLTFGATVFIARYPNANFLRFRDDDLDALAASFAGQPFLRNHDTSHIESRDGTIISSRMDYTSRNPPLMIQEIKLTTRRGIRSLLEQQIDRFSIGWYFDSITCSVCESDWFRCSHWPGRRYQTDAGESLCELIFENPRGKETSAVNAPAVDGTGILSQLCNRKETIMSTATPDTVEDRPSEAETPTAPTEKPPRFGCAAGSLPPALSAERQAAQPELPGSLQPAAEDWIQFFQTTTLDAALRSSGLPAPMQDAVRAQFAHHPPETPAEVESAIDRQRAAWAELQEDNIITGLPARDGGRVNGMLDSQDRIGEALEALIEGRQPRDGIRPLTGIREAYILLSGDYEMTGMFNPDQAALANVDSSTMAGLVANRLNKVVVNMFQQYPRDFLRICTEMDFTTLQDVRWITLGGVGELPTVTEGSAYTEMTWDDVTETDAFTKKGGYLGLTLEAIDKDDTRRIQSAPRALAQAAWLTLTKSFNSIFTSNSGVGPTLDQDSTALFHTNHSNLGTSSLSYSSWSATRIAMRKQTEVNSSERLGGIVVPRYLLVPPDLEQVAVQILASEGEPGTADNDINPFAEGERREERLRAARDRVIVCDLWTDTNNWAAAANPMLYPSIGLGYRFGRAPEIFSVASPTTGLMFTNDVMPIKVRWFYAIGPTDYRGLYKHNVS